MRTDQRLVGKHAPPRQVDDWLENHPEALVAKRLVEGPRRGGNGIGRVHEKQSSSTVQFGTDPWRAHEPLVSHTIRLRAGSARPRVDGIQRLE